MSFVALGLADALAAALSDRGITTPTPVQAGAIPPALAGRDVIASAQTGSGKTHAFALPLVQHLARTPRTRPRRTHVLVLVPTRELAAQVGQAFTDLAEALVEPVKVAIVFGGVSINPQMLALRGGAEVVVATPGRLLDLLDHNALDIARVATLVLDEADRMLDEGFADELQRVLALLPRRRQTLLFSATFPPAVEALARERLHDPVRVEVSAGPATAPDITQRALEVDTARRTPLLRHLVAHEAWDRALVFVATRYASDHVADKLRQGGIAAAAWHGDRSQGARTQALRDFRAGKVKVLVATDVAARGIDIADLPVVVNYDLPRSADDYVHRIGRTGRAGASGLAVSFVTAASEAHFRLIEKRQGQRVARERIAGFEPTEAPPAATPPADGGGVKGRRKSKKDKLREAAGR